VFYFFLSWCLSVLPVYTHLYDNLDKARIAFEHYLQNVQCHFMLLFTHRRMNVDVHLHSYKQVLPNGLRVLERMHAYVTHSLDSVAVLYTLTLLTLNRNYPQYIFYLEL